MFVEKSVFTIQTATSYMVATKAITSSNIFPEQPEPPINLHQPLATSWGILICVLTTDGCGRVSRSVQLYLIHFTSVKFYFHCAKVLALMLYISEDKDPTIKQDQKKQNLTTYQQTLGDSGKEKQF